MRRELIYIAILHSPQDMGTLGQKLPRTADAVRAAADYWTRLERAAKGLQLCWQQVKIYQDGLPNVSAELVARIVAEVESPNYELLRWLVAQGASLMGTESPDLLKEEYGYLRAVLDAPNESARLRARGFYAQRAAGLLAQRDDYIARRIGETLLPGETGILFLGLAHRLAPKLARDITLRVL